MARHALLLLMVLFAANCVRATPSLDVIELVRNRDFNSLEAHFNAIQSSFEQGKTDEYALLDSFRPFYTRTDVLSDELKEWTDAHPKSYVAHLARGTYYRKLGELNRGTSVSRDVPRAAMNYMDQVFEISEKELTTALPLRRNPYLAVLNLLNIARYRSDTVASDRYLAEGNRLLPGNMLVRARYLDHLKPRWGGSYAAMAAFVQRSKLEGVDAANLGLLSAMINDDKGFVAQTNGNLELAVATYKLALSQAEHANPRLQRDYLSAATFACQRGALGSVRCP